MFRRNQNYYGHNVSLARVNIFDVNINQAYVRFHKENVEGDWQASKRFWMYLMIVSLFRILIFLLDNIDSRVSVHLSF